MQNLTFNIIMLLTMMAVSACSSPSDSAFSEYDYTDSSLESSYSGQDLNY